MALRLPLQIKHSPVNTYANTRQLSWVGAQATANQRGWWPELANGPDNGQVNGSKIYNGVLYAVGTFTSVGGGTVRKGTAAWNIYTGALLPWTVDLGTTVDGRCVEADSTGVYIGGAFTNANNVSGQKYLIKTDLVVGTLDSSFTTHPNDAVYCCKIVVKCDGSTVPNYQLLVGGAFTQIPNVTGPAPHICLVRMTTGAKDTAGAPGTCNGPVYALATDYASNGGDLTTGTIYAVGLFSSFNGVTRNRAAAVLCNGGGWVANSWDPNFDGAPNAILAHSNGLIYLGGAFTLVNGGTTRNYACAVDAIYGTLTGWNPNMPSFQYCLAQYEDVILCGGGVGGFNPSAEAVDLAGNKLGWAITANSDIYSLSIFDRTLYAGGPFTAAKGVTAHAITMAPWPYMNDANTIFVAKTGSDAAAGTTAAPVLTLAQALTLVTSTFKYVQVKDNGIYNEDLDLAATTQLFAADGKAPTLARYPGAEIGTYGSRATGRRKFFTGSGAVVRYVSKLGNDSTGTAGDATKPYLTVQAAITACADGDCVSIADSEIYYETLVVAHSITLQAADGKTPSIINLGVAAHTINVTTAKVLALYGLTIIGPSFYTGSTYNCLHVTSGGLSAIYDCTVSGGTNNVYAAGNTVHTDVRNSVFTKAWGQWNFLVTVASGIGAGTSTFQNNYVTADAAAPGTSGVSAVVLNDDYTKVIKNNTIIRGPKALETPFSMAAGIDVTASDTSASSTTIESNYISGAGAGIRLFVAVGNSTACTATVKNNYTTGCDIGYVIWSLVTTAPGPTVTIQNNVGYKNGQNVPANRHDTYGDFYFLTQGDHTISVLENESVGSFNNAFTFALNPTTAGATAAPTIIFRKNVALNAALNGLYFYGLDTIATVSGAIPGSTPFRLTPTVPNSATFISDQGVWLNADQYAANNAQLFSSALNPLPDYAKAVPTHVYQCNGIGTYYFDASLAGLTVYMHMRSDYRYGSITSGSFFQGNVFKNNLAAAVKARYMKTSVTADATQNYYNDNGSINDSNVNADGNVTTPFFITPDALASSGQEAFREVQFVSDTPGSEDLGLLPDSPGRFTPMVQATTPQDDAGMNLYLARFAANRSALDGFVVLGYQNLWGGISVAKGVKDFQAAWCTFQECAFHGLRHLGSANTSRPWLKNCDLASNDNGALDFSPGNTSMLNIFRDNAGAGLYSYLGAARVSKTSAFRNGTGIFESSFATPSVIDKCVLSQNALADASGLSIYTNSIVSVPQGVVLDTTTSQLNPLFKDPLNGDLRLMAVADGDDFDSPALALSAGSYTYIYGTLATAYTLLDFATTGWRNPDGVHYSLVPIKLSEGSKLGGGTYSRAQAYKILTEYSWGKRNDMPLAQLVALKAMFTAANEAVLVSEDAGSTWTPLTLIKSRAPAYEALTGGDFVRDDTPMPIDKLVFREA